MSKSDPTQPKRVVGKPFQPGNPGRPKGSRNKLGEDFLRDMHEAWDKHGRAALEATAVNEPSKFVQVAASLLPKQIDVTHTNMTDEETKQRIAELDAILAGEIGGARGVVPSSRPH